MKKQISPTGNAGNRARTNEEDSELLQKRSLHGERPEDRAAPPNRDRPCLAWGSKQPRTIEELAENREVFVGEAMAVLA